MFFSSEAIDNLIGGAKAGNRSSLNLLVKAMEPIAQKTASYYSGRLADGESFYDDFVQESRIAVIKCLDGFESGRGSFLRYAEYAMKVAVRKYINENYRLIKQPKGKTEMVKKLNKALAFYAMEGILSPSVEELMEKTGFSEKELKVITEIREMLFICSLDYDFNDSSTERYVPEVSSDAVQFEEKMMIDDIEKIIKGNMQSENRYLICSLFGIYGYEKKSIKELSVELEVSPVTIRNRKKQIFEELRSAVA